VFWELVCMYVQMGKIHSMQKFGPQKVTRIGNHADHCHLRVNSLGDMPFGILSHLLTEYRLSRWDVLKSLLTKYGIPIALIYGLRRWCAGGSNYSMRHMASKVVLVTVLFLFIDSKLTSGRYFRYRCSGR